MATMQHGYYERKALKAANDDIIDEVASQFEEDLVVAFTDLGKRAGDLFPGGTGISEGAIKTIAATAVAAASPHFEVAFTSAQKEAAQRALSLVLEATGETAKDIAKPAVQAFIKRQHDHRLSVLLPELTKQTQQAITDAVNHSIESGLGPYEAKSKVRELVAGSGMYPGVASDKGEKAAVSHRAEVIARTEVAWARNTAAISYMAATPMVEELYVVDGPDCGWLHHDDPDKANGKHVTFAAARDIPVGHPNCRRSFGPVYAPYTKWLDNWEAKYVPTEGEPRWSGGEFQLKYAPGQARDSHGRFGSGGGHHAAPSPTAGGGADRHKVSVGLAKGVDQSNVTQHEDPVAWKHNHNAPMSESAQHTAILNGISDHIMANPAALKALEATGTTEQKRSRVREQVSLALTDHAAGQTTARSIAMQRAVSEEFGLAAEWKRTEAHLKTHSPETANALTQANKIHAANGAANKAIARAMYEHTQQHFKDEGITEVTLHRGVAVKTGQEPNWARFGTTPVALGPMSSYSSMGSIAWAYGMRESRNGNATAHIVSARVPVERILSTGRTGFGDLSQGEFVVLGGAGKQRNFTIDPHTGKAVAVVGPGEPGYGKTPKVEAPKPPKVAPPKTPPPPKTTVEPPVVKPKPKPKEEPKPEFNPKKTLAETHRLNPHGLGTKEQVAVKAGVRAVHEHLPRMQVEKHERLETGAISDASQEATKKYYGFSAAGLYSGGVSGKLIGAGTHAAPSADKAGTQVHEIGHYIDNILGQRAALVASNMTWGDAGGQGFHQSVSRIFESDRTGDGVWTSDKHLPTYGVMRAIESTSGYKGWKNADRSTKQQETYADYILKPRELFARAFTQYIATKEKEAGRPDLHNELLGPGRRSTHYKPEDFKPVHEAFDKMFKDLGWTKESGPEIP